MTLGCDGLVCHGPSQRVGERFSISTHPRVPVAWDVDRSGLIEKLGGCNEPVLATPMVSFVKLNPVTHFSPPNLLIVSRYPHHRD